MRFCSKNCYSTLINTYSWPQTVIRYVCIFRWQTILSHVSPPFQKTIYSFKLVVGHTTKREAWSFVRHWSMMTLGWKCHTRAVPSFDIFDLGFIVFQCPLTTVRHLYIVWLLMMTTTSLHCLFVSLIVTATVELVVAVECEMGWVGLLDTNTMQPLYNIVDV